jgi:uncharacterized protein
MHDYPAILKTILEGYTLPVHGDHGVTHWARVLENGVRVAQATGADDDHGLRGGDLARSLRGELVHLDDPRFELLYEACRLHTDGLVEGDPTLQACWDADRLDLGRVGIQPRPHLLCTDATRGLLDWAHARAIVFHEPVEVLAEWGMQAGVPASPND